MSLDWTERHLSATCRLPWHPPHTHPKEPGESLMSQSVSHVSRINRRCIHTELFPDSRHSHACVRISSPSLPLSCLSAPLITTHSHPIGHAPHRTHSPRQCSRTKSTQSGRQKLHLAPVHCLIVCMNVYVFVLVRTERNADRQTDRHETCMLIYSLDGWMLSVPPRGTDREPTGTTATPCLSPVVIHLTHLRRNSPAVSSFLARRLPDHNSD